MVYYPIYGGRQVWFYKILEARRSWWAGPVPPISRLRRQRRRRIEPSILVQSLPQVSHMTWITYEANKQATDSSLPWPSNLSQHPTSQSPSRAKQTKHLKELLNPSYPVLHLLLSKSLNIWVFTTRCWITVIGLEERSLPSSIGMSLFLLWWRSYTYHRRSEVVGRPLAALLANDGARVLSVDIDCTSLLIQ